jgi:bacillopeptidase F
MSRRFISFCILISGLFGQLTFAVTAQDHVVAPDLRHVLANAAAGAYVDVIVRLPKQVSFDAADTEERVRRAPHVTKQLRISAESGQAPVLNWLRSNGVERIRPLWINNSIAVSIRADLVDRLAAFPGVEEIQLDSSIELAEPLYEAASTDEWNLGAIGAPALWHMGFTGRGMVVATMDSGVDLSHPELSDKWRGGSNGWFDPNGEHAAPHDADGHGTQVMGIILGGDRGGSAIGVAPDARWIAVKVFDDKGRSSLSRIHEGFQWLLDPDGDPATDDSPDLVNSSWAIQGSLNRCDLEFREDLRALRAAGIAVVWAAGNAGPYQSSSYSPANYPESFAVGASARFMPTPALTSSRGPSPCEGAKYPTVLAPGVGIRTCDLTFGGVIANSYVSVSGTSFAAAHVTGAMALLMQAAPRFSSGTLERALKRAARNSPGEPDNDSGYGMIDVERALWLLPMPRAARNDPVSGLPGRSRAVRR